jgi:hypothetical protein
MNDYNSEQYTAYDLVRRHLEEVEASINDVRLAGSLSAYLAFRRSVDRYLQDHFAGTCHDACYRNRLSACCSKEGIITFFGDIVVNALVSSLIEIDGIMNILQNPRTEIKCVYLGEKGCLWRVKPIVCTMFLCDRAQAEVFGANPDLQRQWAKFQELKKRFTWPDRPVLFDELESIFLKAGHTSSLMYLHNSPGLLKVKKEAMEKSKGASKFQGQ